MAASSQYHRGAPAPHSHYHALPGSHEHLYADLATSWNSSHGALSRGPAGTVVLQRFSSPAHRPPAHTGYLDYSGGGSSDYVNPNPNPPPSHWPTTPFTRAPSQPWSSAFASDQQPFPPRPLPYADPSTAASTNASASTSTAGGGGGGGTTRLPAPHHAHPRPPRQPDHASQIGLSSPASAPLPAQDDHHGHHAPAFPPDAPTLAPLLNYADPSQVSPQAAHTWAPAAAAALSPVVSQHPYGHAGHAGHAGHLLSPDVGLSSEASLPSAAWAMVSSGSSNSAAHVVYEQQLPDDTAQLWHVEPDSHHIGHVHPVISSPTYPRTTYGRGKRPQPKKATAKVPAAFVARQQKSKVSKRKGPLDEEGRQKTHNMRKLKMSCIRCRFYKSGVRPALFHPRCFT